MKNEEFNDVVLREKERSLFISRVPKNTKDRFMELANSEFAGDYGLLLQWIYSQAIEYQNMKSVFFESINMKLDSIINLFSSKNEEQFSNDIKLLDGKVLKGGKKHGKEK